MATSNETFGLMKPGEEMVVRLAPDGRSYCLLTRKSTVGVGGAPGGIGLTGGVIPTKYTSAATLATAVQNALPTLYS